MNGGKERLLKTKVICTLGPASSDPATIQALSRAGMDAARLNMSHSTAEQVRSVARSLRECEVSSGKPLTLLVDLQGPKLRVGELAGERRLEPGERIVLAPSDQAGPGDLPVTYATLADEVGLDGRILLDDGRVELRVRGLAPPRVEAEVVQGGVISRGKGINLPGVRVSAPALTEKDVADLELALEVGADCVALSFVRSASDVRDLRSRLPDDVLLMAKIEKDVALDDIDSIIEESDSVMVARGDLGTELPFENVPLVQKRIVRQANTRYRPVVIATQMLESMVERPRPTRAEVSDVANAILDGTDAVLLAAETAIGRYPVAAVSALARVIREIESASSVLATGPAYDVPPPFQDASGPTSTELAIACATVEAVRAIRAPAIVTLTSSGFTARVVSSRRPPVPILAVTDSPRVVRQLAMVWGVAPVLCTEEASWDNMWAVARAELIERGLAGPGDRVVVTLGIPFHVRGTTNVVRIETLTA